MGAGEADAWQAGECALDVKYWACPSSLFPVAEPEDSSAPQPCVTTTCASPPQESCLRHAFREPSKYHPLWPLAKPIHVQDGAPGKRNIYVSPAKKGTFGYPWQDRSIGNTKFEFIPDEYCRYGCSTEQYSTWQCRAARV